MSAWRRAPICRSTKVVEAELTVTKELQYLGGVWVRHSGSGSSPLCIGPESFRSLSERQIACTVGEHSAPSPGVGGVPAAFQSCLAAAVRGPERFLGRVCSYGACITCLQDSPAADRRHVQLYLGALLGTPQVLIVLRAGRCGKWIQPHLRRRSRTPSRISTSASRAAVPTPWPPSNIALKYRPSPM